jgi:sulfate transport system permease protein
MTVSERAAAAAPTAVDAGPAAVDTAAVDAGTETAAGTGHGAAGRRVAARRRPPPHGDRWGTGVGLGAAVSYLSLVVLIPLAAVVVRSQANGIGGFWRAVRTPDAWSALELTVVASFVVGLVNLFMGTLIAWILVRDSFPGKRIVDALIDLPFALPTIVAGLVLLALYGQQSPLGVNLAYTRVGVIVALLFVTLPFVIRTVQPVLLELDRDMEQAAWSLGAGPWLTFRRIILPNLVPAMVSGTALAFTRAMAEFGSTVLISGNLPFRTQVAAVNIFGQIESDNTTGAAAASTVLLVVALVVLVILDLIQRWGARRG